MAHDVELKTIPIRVGMGAVGQRKKVKTGKVSVAATNGEKDPDKDFVYLAKELYDSKTLQQILSLQGKVRSFLQRRSVQSRTFRRVYQAGIYVLPVSELEKVYAGLQKFKDEMDLLVDYFLVDEYAEEVKRSEERLGVLFDRADYPPEEEIRKAFYLEWQIIDLGVPDRLEELSSALFEAEKQKAQKVWEEAAEEIRMGLRQGFKSLVDHLADRLTVGADGKKKIFRDSLVGNFQEFLDLFSPKNVTDDQELAKLVDQCRSLMDGVTPDELRMDASAAETVRLGMEEVKKGLDILLQDVPMRRITL